MTKDQIKARIAELKYDYIRIQEDIEKRSPQVAV